MPVRRRAGILYRRRVAAAAVIVACLRRFPRLTPSRIEYNRKTRSRNDAHGEKGAHGIRPSCTRHVEAASLRLIKERRDG